MKRNEVEIILAVFTEVEFSGVSYGINPVCGGVDIRKGNEYSIKVLDDTTLEEYMFNNWDEVEAFYNRPIKKRISKHDYKINCGKCGSNTTVINEGVIYY